MSDVMERWRTERVVAAMHGTTSSGIRELGIRSAVGVPIIVDGRVWGAAIVGLVGT